MQINTSGNQPEQSNQNRFGKVGHDRTAEERGTERNTSMASANGVDARESGEGTITKQIESVTSKIPSATFLSLAVASIGLSALLQVCGRKQDAQFVGQWVPTILTLGLYNKLVKLEGSE